MGSKSLTASPATIFLSSQISWYAVVRGMRFSLNFLENVYISSWRCLSGGIDEQRTFLWQV
jgi:hypothetical protein